LTRLDKEGFDNEMTQYW